MQSKRAQERSAFCSKFIFKLLCTIAIAAGPRFTPIFVPAFPSGMGVFDADELEILFPIRPFFSQRGIAETSLHPGCGIVTNSRFAHIINVLVTGDGAPPERAVVDRAQERF